MVDSSTSKANISVVDNGALAGRDSPYRLKASESEALPVSKSDKAILISHPVADL